MTRDSFHTYLRSRSAHTCNGNGMEGNGRGMENWGRSPHASLQTVEAELATIGQAATNQSASMHGVAARRSGGDR